MQGGNQTSQTEQIALAADCRSTRSSSEAGPGALSAVNSPVCALRAAPSSGDEGPATIHAGSVQELGSGLAPVHGNRCLLRVMWREFHREQGSSSSCFNDFCRSPNEWLWAGLGRTSTEQVSQISEVEQRESMVKLWCLYLKEEVTRCHNEN